MLALTFQVGPESVGVDIRRVHAVVPRVVLTPVSGSASWLAGTFVFRGEIVPVIDLFRLAGGGACPTQLSSRIVLVSPAVEAGLPQLIGLLASDVADIREIDAGAAAARSARPTDMIDLGPAIVDGSSVMRMLDPDRLLPTALRSEVGR
jgi:chemotaxis-related protein WspB